MSDLSSLANTSVVNYVSFCFLFFVFKYRYFAKDKFIWVFIFFSLACILQFINNVYLSSLPSFCGEANAGVALYATLMPWIIVFGSFCIFLFIFPGWLRAFSNTFGLKAAQMFGVDEVIGQIMIPDEREKATTAAGNNIDLLRAIDSIYTGKTMLVREMSPDDFVAYIPQNGKIVNAEGKELTDKDGALLPLKDGDRDITYYNSKLLEKFIKMNLLTKAPPDLISNLHHKIILKDTVGQFVWFLLIGSLTVLISTNTLLNSGCTTKNGNYNTIFNS
jgi:hypothetical protein